MLGFPRNIKRLLKKYRGDEAGQFALWVGIMGIPISLGVGAALDMENGNRFKNILEAALDSAALAAVQPAGLTDLERRGYAESVFYDNFPDAKKYATKLDIDATREEVEMVATIEVPTFVKGSFGGKALTISENSKAVLTKSDTICVLALDKTSPDSLVFADKAIFNASACSVQVNSVHPQAMRSSSLTPPSALNFCSAGGAIGSYQPSVKTNCSPVEDPYADLVIPPPGVSCDDVAQVKVRDRRGWYRDFRESEMPSTVFGDTLIPDWSTLSPGIYCRGLTFSGVDIDLEPGVYHVWGDLHFTNAAQVRGDGVTFILKGTNSRLLIDEGASVSLKAPSEGLTAGLVFWQKYLKFFEYAMMKRVAEAPDEVIATSEVKNGGGLHIVGTAYLPNHKLVISSDNAVSTQSPATSFIAYQIEFSGRANMQVAVDHVAAGLPPFLPYSDDGARLVD